MENKKKASFTHGKSFKNFIGKTEKRCNKCGFVTFCLRVLYRHKYRCQGLLLGSPFICSYCKRKFSFITLYRQHKRVCVKGNLKKILKIKKVKKDASRKPPKISVVAPKQTILVKSSHTCPFCSHNFQSNSTLNAHLKKGMCKSKQIKMPERSARKSFTKKHGKFKAPKVRKSFPNRPDTLQEFYSPLQKLKEEKHIHGNIKDSDANFMCLWCKSIYPTKKLLLKHLERNDQCTKAHYQQNSFSRKTKVSYTARKTVAPVVARKSFSRGNPRNISRAIMHKFSGGSARKTVNNSLHKRNFKIEKFHSAASSSVEYINQCPVCYEEFSDSFNFFQHQKVLNHWGKATKSTNMSCRCPFCEKEFYHVRARNAHLRNHADRSEEDIELFLKNSTCNICSQIFVSELVKQQHMKIEHPPRFDSKTDAHISADVSSDNAVDSSFNHKQNMSSKLKYTAIPSSLKKKLKQQPHMCPICLKDFSSTFVRNKHFHENHLDSIFECKFCNLRLNKADSLAQHMQQCHQANLAFECLICKVCFPSEMQVLQHAEKMHSDQDPKTLVCSKNLGQISNLDKPSGGESGGIDVEKVNCSDIEIQVRNLEYYCDICEISFQKLCGLQRHRQSKQHRDTLEKNLDAVHKSLATLPPSSPPIPKVVKQPEIIRCAECSEEFTSLKYFVPHRLSHFSFQKKYLEITETNPYTCEICDDKLDSHSKVQFHLFFHLQFESASKDKSNTANMAGKNDPIMPDRLCGQHVAKKSFSKQNSESLQEVIIGGVKKPLFTCEDCNIGFTTKAHYNMHIRKFCRMKNLELQNREPSKPTNIESIESCNTYLSDKEIDTGILPLDDDNIVHCTACNCLFSSLDVYDLHIEFCNKYLNVANNAENNLSVDIIKTAMKLECAVAGCVTCGMPLSNLQNVSEHIILHQAKSLDSFDSLYSKSDLKEKDLQHSVENVLHCNICDCLFSSTELFEIHKEVCEKCVLPENRSKNGNTDVLKSALELNCAVAGCISCSLTFDNFQSFSEHMIFHHTKLSDSDQNKNNENTFLNGQTDFANKENNMDEKCASFDGPTSAEFLIDLSENCSESIDGVFETEEMNSSHKSLGFISNETCDSLSNTVNIVDTNDSMPIILEDETLNTEIDILRRNFSQLLCLLVSDPELMQQLGYGKQLVDNVLIHVLQRMGLSPVLDDGKISDLDRLRKNIQILLDSCLTDQVMELLASGKTSTDDMVIEALKMFSSETTTTSVTVSMG